MCQMEGMMSSMNGPGMGLMMVPVQTQKLEQKIKIMPRLKRTRGDGHDTLVEARPWRRRRERDKPEQSE